MHTVVHNVMIIQMVITACDTKKWMVIAECVLLLYENKSSIIYYESNGNALSSNMFQD